MNLDIEPNTDGSSSTKTNSNKADSESDESPSVLKKITSTRDTKPFIGNIDQAPDYLVKCNYILSGYRIGFNNFKSALKTLFIMHNETTNIWSHLYGAFVYIFLIFYILFWTVPDSRLGLSDEDTVMGLSVGFIKSFNAFITKHILWLEPDIVDTHDITKFPFMVHMGGSIFCMAMSSIYHLF